jgi:hypothetical protein
LRTSESTFINRKTKFGLAYLCIREIDLFSFEKIISTQIYNSPFMISSKTSKVLLSEANRCSECFCYITTVKYRTDRAEVNKVLREMLWTWRTPDGHWNLNNDLPIHANDHRTVWNIIYIINIFIVGIKLQLMYSTYLAVEWQENCKDSR